MSNKNTRELRIKNLKKTQEARKQDTKNKVYKAIEKLHKRNAIINFHTVAREAQVSVSYLYKYPEIKQHIAELRSQQNSLPKKIFAKTNSNSQGKLISRLKERIKKLEEEKKELKRKCEALTGQVYRFHHLQSQVERLQQHNEDLRSKLDNQEIAKKVTPIDKKRQSQSLITGNQNISSNKEPLEAVLESIRVIGVKVNNKLREEILSRDIEKVKLSIEAYKQYRDSHDVKSQEACLISMICDGAEPNTESKAQVNIKPQNQIYITQNKTKKKLISSEKLKTLSNIFNK